MTFGQSLNVVDSTQTGEPEREYVHYIALCMQYVAR